MTAPIRFRADRGFFYLSSSQRKNSPAPIAMPTQAALNRKIETRGESSSSGVAAHAVNGSVPAAMCIVNSSSRSLSSMLQVYHAAPAQNGSNLGNASAVPIKPAAKPARNFASPDKPHYRAMIFARHAEPLASGDYLPSGQPESSNRVVDGLAARDLEASAMRDA